MDGLWTGVVAGVISALIAALLIVLAKRVIEVLRPSTILISSVLVGFVLLGIAWFTNNSDFVVAAVVEVVTGVVGAWHATLPSDRTSRQEQSSSGPRER